MLAEVLGHGRGRQAVRAALGLAALDEGVGIARCAQRPLALPALIVVAVVASGIGSAVGPRPAAAE
jgi:hypothetical protein